MVILKRYQKLKQLFANQNLGLPEDEEDDSGAEQDEESEDGSNHMAFIEEEEDGKPAACDYRSDDFNARLEDTTETSFSTVSFVKKAREELADLERLARSTNFCNTKVNWQRELHHLKSINRLIRQEMSAASRHNTGQQWVSTNPH